MRNRDGRISIRCSKWEEERLKREAVKMDYEWSSYVRTILFMKMRPRDRKHLEVLIKLQNISNEIYEKYGSNSKIEKDLDDLWDTISL